MSMTKEWSTSASVEGISSAEAIKWFETMLENTFGITDIPDKAEHTLLHKLILLPKKQSVHVTVCSGDVVRVFGKIAAWELEGWRAKMVQLAEQAVIHPEEGHTMAVQRAREILGFVNELDLSDGRQRKMAVILSEICSEIVVREKLRALNIDCAPFDEGITGRTRELLVEEQLGNRRHAVVDVATMEELRQTRSPIKELRQMRNLIVHDGEKCGKEEAEEALRIATNAIVGLELHRLALVRQTGTSVDEAE